MTLRRWAVYSGIICSLLVCLVVLAALFLWTDSLTKPAVAATCTDSLQDKIDAAEAGGTVIAEPCIYREALNITKPITLEGQPGSEIRGSDIWSGWSEESDGTWVSTQTVPYFPAHGECAPNSGRCLRPEQVFVDGEPLRQIGQGGEPAAGQFALDDSRHVVLGEDPSGKTVEVTVRSYWIRGEADNVTIEGFTMRHSANDAQSGALENNGHSGWSVKDSGLFWAHGLNLKFEGGSNFDLLNTELAYAGQMGFGSYRVSELNVRGVSVHHNNTEAFNTSWEAGGVKFSRTSNLSVMWGNWYDNDGQGIWCDIECDGATIAHNRIHHNDKSGIFYEISDNAKIFGNILWENGWKYGAGAWRGAIRATNARGVEIYDNTLAWNQSGISLISVNRTDYPQTNLIHNNLIHDNTVMMENISNSSPFDSCARPLALAYCESDVDFGLFSEASNNRGYGNRYYYPEDENDQPRFNWGERGYTSLAVFSATPGEEGGSYLTESEKDAVAEEKGIPAAPEQTGNRVSLLDTGTE